jgi:tetratricopeptide (TPR) repeat protein
VLGDGGALTEAAAIQTICRGQKRTEAYTDSRGNFSFQFGHGSTPSEYAFDADNAEEKPLRGQPERRGLLGCELQASLAGFRSDVIQLDHFDPSDNANVGNIVLHRMQNVEGFTISATTAKAPDRARNSWKKGRKQSQKGKWEDAQRSFEKAVDVYPDFAAAWFELGQVHLQRNNLAGARHSFEQSIAADSKYINPYFGLARLALRSRTWPELTIASEKVLSLNPVSFPDVWLWNGLANYNLGNLVAAEQSARRGLELDREHHLPGLEYLLGLVLMAKADYSEAARHLHTFLRLAQEPADIAEAQKQLDLLAHLSNRPRTNGK